jgi:hypothetical protein
VSCSGSECRWLLDKRGFDRFVEVLDRKLGEMEARIRADFKSEIQSLKLELQVVRTDIQTVKAELLREQRDQMLRFVALVSLVVGILGTAIGFLVKKF